MNNSVYGKTMENLRNRIDIRLVCKNGENDEKAEKKVSSPSFKSSSIQLITETKGT
jgi:hypothetical protein